MDIEDDEDYASEGVFSDSISGINMKFKYESTEDIEDEIIHSGYLEIDGDEFYGEIYCDPEGDYSTCNFEDPDGINLFEKYEGLEREVESFLYSVCDEIKGSNAV
jgi:glycyl-tRNA synthetase alpha subunit